MVVPIVVAVVGGEETGSCTSESLARASFPATLAGLTSYLTPWPDYLRSEYQYLHSIRTFTVFGHAITEMAEEENTRVRTSTEFIEDTILEAFVPSASCLDIQSLLENWDGEVPEDGNSIVPFIEQRTFLLLGKIIWNLFFQDRLLLITGI